MARFAIWMIIGVFIYFMFSRNNSTLAVSRVNG